MIRRKPISRRPASVAKAPRQHLYTVALSERVPEVTDHWRGQHLMRIAATSPEEARQQAMAKAARYGITLKPTDILDVKGGDRPA